MPLLIKTLTLAALALVISLLFPAPFADRVGLHSRFRRPLEIAFSVLLWTGVLLLLDRAMDLTGMHGYFETQLVGRLLALVVLIVVIAPAYWLRRRGKQHRRAQRRHTPHDYIPPCIEK